MWCESVAIVRLVAPLLIFAKNSQTALPKKCFFFVGMLIFSTVALRLQATVFGFARERIACTNTQSKYLSSNLAKLFIRSFSPVLLQNRCYSQWFLSDVLANYCKYYLSLPLSYWSVWLCIFLFLKGRIFLIQSLSALER